MAPRRTPFRTTIPVPHGVRHGAVRHASSNKQLQLAARIWLWSTHASVVSRPRQLASERLQQNYRAASAKVPGSVQENVTKLL